MDDKNRSFSTDNTDDDDYVDMVLDDGTELHCSVIAIFPVEGQQYIALLPDKKTTSSSTVTQRRKATTSNLA